MLAFKSIRGLFCTVLGHTYLFDGDIPEQVMVKCKHCRFKMVFNDSVEYLKFLTNNKTTAKVAEDVLYATWQFIINITPSNHGRCNKKGKVIWNSKEYFCTCVNQKARTEMLRRKIPEYAKTNINILRG